MVNGHVSGSITGVWDSTPYPAATRLASPGTHNVVKEPKFKPGSTVFTKEFDKGPFVVIDGSAETLMVDALIEDHFAEGARVERIPVTETTLVVNKRGKFLLLPTAMLVSARERNSARRVIKNEATETAIIALILVMSYILGYFLAWVA